MRAEAYHPASSVTITRYRVPTEGAVPHIVDLTTAYRDTIVRSLTTAGHVHPRKFWRLPALGDTSVFVGGREPTDRIRASIALLWDFSSSQGGFLESLIHSLAVVGSSLRRVGIAVWAGAYTNAGSGVGIFEVCNWPEHWDHRRVTALSQVGMNGTPTGEAMHYARRFIMPRAPHSRQMFVVCTDGGPNSPELMYHEIAALRAMRVVVVGLYVGPERSAIQAMEHQFGTRYTFSAPTRDDIPLAFNRILGRLRG